MDVTAQKLHNPYTEDMLIAVVTDVVSEVLGSDQSELTFDMSLGDDLGAESLDFVEIRYHLERRLGIALPQRSVFDHLSMLAPEIPVVSSNGKITAFGAKALQGSLFGYSDSLAREGARPNDVMQGGTIRNWARLCLGILDELPHACPDCGHREAIVSRTGKPACASCGAVIKPKSGDDAMAAATEAWLTASEETATAA
jgi:acyl carrier protein